MAAALHCPYHRRRRCRLGHELGGDAAASELLGALVYAIDAQKEVGAPEALRALLAPAASSSAAAAAVVTRRTAQLKPPPSRVMSGGPAAVPFVTYL